MCGYLTTITIGFNLNSRSRIIKEKTYFKSIFASSYRTIKAAYRGKPKYC